MSTPPASAPTPTPASAADRIERDRAIAREVLLHEAATLTALAESLDPAAFSRALDLLESCRGQVVLTGLGKSGHIARKIASTLASTGTPSFFLHPAEALHGDLGMLRAGHVVVALSQTGATEELLNITPYLKRLEIPLIALTGNAQSRLAREATVVLLTQIEQEACPLNLAPTASTTAQIAVGDALAIGLMKRRGFTNDDFALRHPLGSLGRRLLMRVADVMHKGEAVPVVAESAPLRQAISEMTGKRLGAVCVIDASGALAGIFCDGDLRRLFARADAASPLDPTRPISQFMVRTPRHTTPDTLGVKAVDLMETHKITVLPVLDAARRPVGMVHIHDLISLGIV